MTVSVRRCAPRVLLPAFALVTTLAVAGCGEDEPSGADSSEGTSEPTSESTDELTTETTDPTGSTENAGSDVPVDLCTVDTAEIESTLGWTFEGKSGFEDLGSCTFSFDAADLAAGYDPPSVSELRDQSVASGYVIEEIEGVGDEAFAATLPETTPAHAAVAAEEGDIVLYIAAFAADETAAEDDLIEALTVLARLCLEAAAS